jgi:hypothetical protein
MYIGVNLLSLNIYPKNKVLVHGEKADGEIPKWPTGADCKSAVV